MNEGSGNAGKGGVNGDFVEEVMQILAISVRWGSILKDLIKHTYHDHIKPEIQYRIRDLSLLPDKIVKGIRESEKE